MAQPCVESSPSKLNTSNIGPMLVDNSDGKPLPKKFKYIDQNFIRPNIRKQFRSKHLLLSCVCQYRYIHVEKANGQVVEEACNDECLNRQIYIECVNCEWGNYCTNRNFTRGCQFSLLLFAAGAKGWGVKSLDYIERGSFVIEYNGEIITQDEFQERSIRYENNNTTHFYTMALAENFVIDATSKGNISRFINHSCDPNLMTQLWSVDGYHRMGFFAIKDIQPGTELSFDYNFIRFNSKPQKCFCKAKNCTGEIGKSIMSQELTTDTLTTVSPSLIDESGSDNCKRISIKSTIKQQKGRSKPKSQPPTENEKNHSNAINIINTINVDGSSLKSRHKAPNSSLSPTVYNSSIEKKSDPLLNQIQKYVHSLDMKKDTSSVQKFLHFVIRSKSIEHKVTLLDCLLKCHTEQCLLEFLRYKLLVLLWSWTTDDESYELAKEKSFILEYRDKFVDALELFRIPYRNAIEESKLENRLTEWKQEILESITDTTGSNESQRALCDRIVGKIERILIKWGGLAKKFKIPKKPITNNSNTDSNSYSKSKEKKSSFNSSCNKSFNNSFNNKSGGLTYDPAAKHRKEINSNTSPSLNSYEKRFKSNSYNSNSAYNSNSNSNGNYYERRYDSYHARKIVNSNSGDRYSNSNYGKDNYHQINHNSQYPRKFESTNMRPTNIAGSTNEINQAKASLSNQNNVTGGASETNQYKASLSNQTNVPGGTHHSSQYIGSFSNQTNVTGSTSETNKFQAFHSNQSNVTGSVNQSNQYKASFSNQNNVTGGASETNQYKAFLSNQNNVIESVNQSNQYKASHSNQNSEDRHKATGSELLSLESWKTPDTPSIGDPRQSTSKFTREQDNHSNSVRNIYTGQPEHPTAMDNLHISTPNKNVEFNNTIKDSLTKKDNSPDKVSEKTQDEVYLEKFNRRYIIPNWDSNDKNNQKFKDDLAVYVVHNLRPYYGENDFDNPQIKVHSKMEFKYLAKKITHLIIMKELRFIERSTGKSLIELNRQPHTKPILQLDVHIKERIKIFFKEFMGTYLK